MIDMLNAPLQSRNSYSIHSASTVTAILSLFVQQNTPYEHGRTNTAEALKMVREEIFSRRRGDRFDVQNVVLMVTDGESNNERATIEESRRLRDEGTTILCLG